MAINDPYSGVVFDPERSTIVLTHGQSEYPLYHCPFCGGAFPDSSHPVWVPIVPKEEFERVEQLVADLADADAVVSRLGPPDYDEVTHSHRSCNGTLLRDENSRPVRNIEYYGHSDWLAIEFYITGGRGATHRLAIKNLSPRHRVGAEPGAPPNGGSVKPPDDAEQSGGPPSGELNRSA